MRRQLRIDHSLRIYSARTAPFYLHRRCTALASFEQHRSQTIIPKPSPQHLHPVFHAVNQGFATKIAHHTSSTTSISQPSLSFLLPSASLSSSSVGTNSPTPQLLCSEDSPVPPIEIRLSPGKGRGLFATRSLKRGEIVWSESPLLSARLLSFEAPVDADDVDEVELVDELDQTTSSQTMLADDHTETKGFCAHCHAPLMKPLLIAPIESEPDRFELVENSEDVWDELRKQSQLQKQLSSLLPTEVTRCRTAVTTAATTEAGPPCEERYCSMDCEKSAWHFSHALEHMSDEEVRRFTHDNGAMADLMLDADKVHVMSLVLRVIAALRSSSAASSTSSDQRKLFLQSLSQLAVPRNISTHVLSMQDWSGIEQAAAPLLTSVFTDQQQRGYINEQVMRHALKNVEGGDNMSREVLLLRALVGAIITNSFHLIRIQPSLVLTAASASSSSSSSKKKAATNISIMSRPPLSRDGVTELPVWKQSYAALFGTACFLNHACEPFNNIAVELDHVDSTAATHSTSHLHSLVRFATLRDIAAGEELLYSYRQSDEYSTQELEMKYGFKCRCPHCMQLNKPQN